jgi:hypothetical protein
LQQAALEGEAQKAAAPEKQILAAAAVPQEVKVKLVEMVAPA